MTHEKKTPLIRLAKRDGMEAWKIRSEEHTSELQSHLT